MAKHDDEIRFFLTGLRSVINRNWATHEEFAQGVTSKPNLSNILNMRSGTSLEMRRKLAEKAGMSIEDIVSLGKGLQPEVLEEKTNAKVANNRLKAPFDENSLATMEAGELIKTTAKFGVSLTEHVLADLKMLNETINYLVGDRNRLLEAYQYMQTVINSINEGIKVINHDLGVFLHNRAHIEIHGQEVGELCAGEKCNYCKGSCLANKCLASGRQEFNIVAVNGTWFYKSAYPMFSATGKISSVVVVTRDMTAFTKLATEKFGWVIPDPADKEEV